MDLNSTPHATQLLLRLLAVAEQQQLDSRAAIAAGALFDISANAMRVALARLQAKGLIQSVERGCYRLGEKGQILSADVAAWRNAEQAMVQWDQSWLAVSLAGQSRRDRKTLRVQQRALALLGMCPWHSGLYLRPNNIQGAVTGLTARLKNLGLSEQAVLFRLSDLAAEQQQQVCHLWDSTALEQSYHQLMRGLQQATIQLKHGSLPDAARQSYVIGDAAIRQMIFDPMLPEPLLDVKLRQQCRQQLQDFDALGHEIWANFLVQCVGDRLTQQISNST
ncbi:hypothetical protein BFG52_09740 [Acinetobacter larvae]|uniref:Transcriptional repressor PaaX-like C-terminal domain-containing protein n=2 Tax=Acinetobacter larvae TaxID=1789224 RepID=A0A1B2M4F3_9GAMM|nr:hypothetical protein BFG52_09740 [Acinetobacter larvae]